MLADPVASFPPSSRRGQKGAGGHLRAAIVALSAGCGEVVAHSERPWASITFEGSRHTLSIEFKGHAAVECGERFVCDLPEHEFAIPGQIAAEATVSAVDHVLLPEPKMTVTCDILLLRDR